ncbi:MAG: aminopeptidase P family protein [Eubacteriales bacterium]|nr:aminopeptidase P family protein [Eubacteriales bacterium]
MHRTEQLKKLISLQQGEAIIIHKPSNMFYISGFKGEGLLYISNAKAAVVTDFRYVEQAEKESPKWSVESISAGVDHIKLASMLESGIKKLYIEDDFVTLRQFKRLEASFKGAEFVSLNQAPEKMRAIKDEKEIAIIKKACAISCEAFDYMLKFVAEGKTEREIALALDFKMYELGAEDVSFSTIAASGANGSLPHAVPSDRVLGQGDFITLDFGAKYAGYCSDMTRTLAVGEPSEKLREIYNIVLQAQEACQKELRPGKSCKEVDGLARKIIGDAGYGEYFGHGLGHAVGIDIHEEPRLSQTSEATLQPGHVVTVEPGIYLPSIGGVRIENTCLITEDGFESLITSPKELIIL